MDSNKQHKIKFTALLYAITLVLISELFFSKILNVFLLPILTIMVIRTIQILWLFCMLKQHKLNLKQGFKTGLLWSFLFGAIAIILYFFFSFMGIHSLEHLAIKLPKDNFGAILFCITAGLISPIAEEIFFRGFIYAYFRKYNLILALILSTTFFALPHFPSTIFPIVPIVGGVIFALSFEYSKSLAAPIIIHISGNLAIFALSFLMNN
jgi:membrane protease YdiL (CAAX protease family)